VVEKFARRSRQLLAVARDELELSRSAQASLSDTVAICIAIDSRCAEEAGSTPTPTPASIIRQIASKLLTWMRGLKPRPASSARRWRKRWMALPWCRPTCCSSSVSAKATEGAPAR
jgi:hypothetical protein